MKDSNPVFMAIFVLVGAGMLMGMLLLFLRGERVGSMKLPARMGVRAGFLSGGTLRKVRVRLTIARESGAKPTVQLRVAIPMAFFMQRIDNAKALDLARLLETASSRSRAP